MSIETITTIAALFTALELASDSHDVEMIREHASGRAIERMDSIDAVIEAIATREGQWTGREWECDENINVTRLERALDDDTLDEIDREMLSVEIDKARDRLASHDRDVSSAASLAETYAVKAREALSRGDLTEAMSEIKTCADMELEYGDDPTWGPMVAAIRTLSDH